jgi:hypothetical protein
MTKAMRRRIALQSTSCEIHWRGVLCFAPAFGVRTRPRVAFWNGLIFLEVPDSEIVGLFDRVALERTHRFQMPRVQPLTSILSPPRGEANNGAARFDLAQKANWVASPLPKRRRGG